MSEEFNPISLNASLDDIEDLPQFKAFPSGSYIVRLDKGLEAKKIGEKSAIDMAMTLVEVAEVTQTGAEPPKQGDIASTLFMLDNAVGAGKLKEVLKAIQPTVGGTTIAEIIGNTKGLTLAVVLKHTKEKDGDKEYNNIVKLAVV